MRSGSGSDKQAPGLGRALALGGLVFAAGLALAAAWLPEWRAGNLPEREFFVRRFHALARKAGVTLALGTPVVFLTTGDEETRICQQDV